MEILVVGAGAVGGYFGGRLLEKGENVTFLVREKREQQLQEKGLVIRSVHGDVTLHPNTLLSGANPHPYDVIILSTKAYHLETVIEDIRPYVGANTMILPLLNGISHIDSLLNNFKDENVIGGLCFVESTMDESGAILQSSPIHDVVFGERGGELTDRIKQLQKVFEGTKANFTLSKTIDQEMWHKYLFITTLSGVTSLFRAPIGPIREQAYGMATIKNTLREATSIMKSAGAPLADTIEEILLEKLQSMGYDMKSSLQRDMEKQLSIEADHLYGYILNIAAQEQLETPTLQTIYANLQVYENIVRYSK